MKRNVEPSSSSASKRKTRSVAVDSLSELHSVAEFTKSLPQVMNLASYDGLNREEPALLRDFVAVEYTDKNRRVSA